MSVVRSFLCPVACTYHVMPVMGQFLRLLVCTHLVMLMVIQFICPMSLNFSCQRWDSFSVLCYITCSGVCSGQSVSPYCDIPSFHQRYNMSCLPEHNAVAMCELRKYRSVLDAKFQVWDTKQISSHTTCHNLDRAWCFYTSSVIDSHSKQDILDIRTDIIAPNHSRFN